MRKDRINYSKYRQQYVEGKISYSHLKHITLIVSVRLLIQHILLDVFILLALVQSFIRSYYTNNILQMTAAFIEIYIIFKKAYDIVSITNSMLVNTKKERKEYGHLYEK